MKRTAAFLLGVLLLVSACQAVAAQAVAFDDPVLEAALREAVGKPEGDVTDKDLAKITSLEIPRQYEQYPDLATQVHSLAVLAYCTKLTALRLNFQNITDIVPLAKLTKLKTLEVGGNPIADIAPLAKLTALTTLALFNCQAADYSVLAKLKNLTTLYLDHSTISDLTPLSKLTKLKALGLKATQVADVTPLSKLTALRALFLADCPIADYSPIRKISAKLTEKDFDPDAAPRVAVAFDDPVLELALRKELHKPDGDVFEDELAALTYVGTGFDYEQNPPEGTRVKSIAALRHCVNLTELELQFNQIADAAPLANLTKLTYLGLGGNPIADVRPLAGLTNLTSLSLFNARAGDYAVLANLSHLKELSMDFSDITDLSPLSGLTELTSLHLKDCAIADFTPIAGILPNLTDLNFDPMNPVTAIAFSDPMLEALIRDRVGKPEGDVTNRQAEQITELAFERFDDRPAQENIFDLSALRYCTGLQHLTLKNIAATDYSALSGLTNLEWLDLTGSAISDAAPLAGMTNLQALTLCFTGVSDLTPLAGMTRLFGLKLEGAPVTDYSPIAALYPNLDKCDFLIPEKGKVAFFDPLLEERVRKAMGKPQGDIAPEEAAALAELNLSQDENSGASIGSLQGLEAFTGLVELNLSGNTQLTSLWPIAGLVGLEKLNCWQCDIRSLAPLRQMTALRELMLGWRGNIGNLDALAGCASLWALDAKGVGITDVGGLAGLPNLRYAGLNNNFITDFSPLASCPALAEVELAGNLTEDYSPLAGIYERLETRDFTLEGAEPPRQPAQASDSGEGWSYDATSRTLYITSDAAMVPYQPNAENAENATGADTPWKPYLEELEQIVVEDGVTRISDYAFAFTPSMRSVEIGKNVSRLGYRCLYRCGDYEAKADLDIVIRCDAMPDIGEDALGYTWDNPHTVLVVPISQAEIWSHWAKGFQLRVSVR